MGGYGFTHTNLGQTEVWVESVYLAASYEKVLSEEFGPSWLRGYHSIRFEVPVHYVFAPDNGLMTGIHFLGIWSFTNLFNEHAPYMLAGGGPVYIDADIPGMSKDLNGTYMFGAGVEFDAGLSHKLKIEYRFSHVSNGGQEKPNVPLNSSNLLSLKFKSTEECINEPEIDKRVCGAGNAAVCLLPSGVQRSGRDLQRGLH